MKCNGNCEPTCPACENAIEEVLENQPLSMLDETKPPLVPDCVECGYPFSAHLPVPTIEGDPEKEPRCPTKEPTFSVDEFLEDFDPFGEDVDGCF
jgi:hypothetical protein